MNNFYETERCSSISENSRWYGCYDIYYNPWEFKRWARETLDFELLYAVCPFPAKCKNRSQFFYSWLEEQPEFLDLFWKQILLDYYKENKCIISDRLDYSYEEWVSEQEDYQKRFLESDYYKDSYKSWEEQEEKYRNIFPYFESNEYSEAFWEFKVIKLEWNDEPFDRFRNTDIFKGFIEEAVYHATVEVLEARKREKARKNNGPYARIYR